MQGAGCRVQGAGFICKSSTLPATLWSALPPSFSFGVGGLGIGVWGSGFRAEGESFRPAWEEGARGAGVEPDDLCEILGVGQLDEVRDFISNLS